MRLPPLPPEQLAGDQKAFYDAMQDGIAKRLQGFVSSRADGALVGPFNAMLHFPQFGQPIWDLIVAIGVNSILPKPVREVAILVVGAHFHSRYEMYAHEHVAERVGLAEDKIATITAGERPSDLSREEAVAYDVAAVLSRGGQLPEATYQMALKTFGDSGVAELVVLVGTYCLVSGMLNAYDVNVPGSEEGVG